MSKVQQQSWTPDTGFGNRVAVGVLVCTVILTAVFVGTVAIFTGEAGNISERLPFYSLAMALAFVVGIVAFDSEAIEPRISLLMAICLAIGTFLIVAPSGEGVVYATENPNALLDSKVLSYFFSAGLVATGLGYWTLQHWGRIRNPSRW